MIGHVLSGYKALALAGAELNFEQILPDCAFDQSGLNLVNLSLFVQCVALNVENEPYGINAFRPSLP